MDKQDFNHLLEMNMCSNININLNFTGEHDKLELNINNYKQQQAFYNITEWREDSKTLRHIKMQILQTTHFLGLDYGNRFCRQSIFQVWIKEIANDMGRIRMLPNFFHVPNHAITQ